MAKKNNLVSNSSDSIIGLINSIDSGAEILADCKTAVINDYIDTGSYILNACMTGSLFKGVPTGRVLTLAGEPGAGKSFLAVSICRNAQKKGYTPIYMDSEAAIDRDFVERLGCDASKFIIKQVTKISEVSHFIANLCQKLMGMKEEERPKFILVLDSLGNLTSDKELTDTIDGNQKRDMTKQQEIKALFRTNMTALGKLNIPFIVNSHIYQTTDLFSKQVVSGGCLVKGEEIITESGCKAIEDVKEGERVLTADGTYQEVLKTFTFEKPTITFTFEDGRTITCSHEHKFLVENNITKDSSWKMAKDLNEDDVILEYDFNKLKIVQKQESSSNIVVHDLCVDNNHTYVSKNGIINHNSGISYNSSLTMMLSTAKLDDKESDKAAASKTGEFLKTGVMVTARPQKSRFTIPQKVKFQIPFFKSPNPYVGLEAYLSWENSGIIRGKMLTLKEYEKLSDADKSKCYEMTDENGEVTYAYPKDTSRNIVVKHLHGEVPITELFTPKVLTEELLRKLDDEVIRPNFELPSHEASTDIDELTEVIDMP